ncbi:MAG: polysaccharide biosynthesis/export family protein [Planctomycetota bacterium]
MPYRIPSGASIQIEVVDEPTLTRSYYIGPHGFFYFPYINEVQVQGLTVRELKGSLEKMLAKYIRRPQVLIHVMGTPSGFRSQQGELTTIGTTRNSIFVFGAASGGNYFRGMNYVGGETLISVLGMTGLPSNSDWRQVRVIRRADADPLRKGRVIMCDLWAYFAYAVLKDWDLTLKFFSDAFFIDTVKESFEKDGAFVD